MSTPPPGTPWLNSNLNVPGFVSIHLHHLSDPDRHLYKDLSGDTVEPRNTSEVLDELYVRFPVYPTWFVMRGLAPAITHVSHPSLITLCLSFNFDLVICLMALHDSFPSSAPVSLVCRCDSITSHPYILLPLSLSKSLSCHLTFSDRHDLSLNTSSMFLLMFLGIAVCCYVARRSMVRMFESEDRTGRKVLCSPIPHVSPWEHSNTPYCCPSVLFLVIKGRTFPLSIVSPFRFAVFLLRDSKAGQRLIRPWVNSISSRGCLFGEFSPYYYYYYYKY